MALELREEHFIKYDNADDFCGLIAEAAAIGFAYHYGYKGQDYEVQFYNENIINFKEKNEHISRFRSCIERARNVIEYYDYEYDNNNLWALMAYLWQNEIGFEYTMSIYDRDCLDDSDYLDYQEMGSIIKKFIIR